MVVEVLIKRGGRGVMKKNICCERQRLSCCNVWNEVDFVGGLLYNLRLREILPSWRRSNFMPR